MRGFHGTGKRSAYFEGWYFKQQTETDTVAFIPAFHMDESGRAFASLQVITAEGAHYVRFPQQAFRAESERLRIQLGDSVFSEDGCELDLDEPGCVLRGELRFGPLAPPAYDIMGPFRFVPFLQCRHSVFSFYHRVDGAVTINGKPISFQNGNGYLEGDRGASFPRRHIWTQCTWENNCVMLSVAHVPFCGGSFTGCIGSLFLNGKERRIATYRGAKLTHISGARVQLRQGNLTLTIQLLQARPHALRAPDLGDMTRTIHESAACRVRYACTLGADVLFDFISEQASFESNWDGGHTP